MTTSPFALALAFAALAGCSPPPEPKPPPAPGYRAALATFCDVDRLGGLAPDAEPMELGRKRTAWIAEHVQHPNAIEMRVYLSVKGAGDQAKMLRDEAREVGLSGCALADSLEQKNEGGIAP